MDFVYSLILILHFIGLASVVGGFLVQMRSPQKGVNPAMLHGALTQLVTGLLLVGLPDMGVALPARCGRETPLSNARVADAATTMPGISTSRCPRTRGRRNRW